MKVTDNQIVLYKNEIKIQSNKINYKTSQTLGKGSLLVLIIVPYPDFTFLFLQSLTLWRGPCSNCFDFKIKGISVCRWGSGTLRAGTSGAENVTITQFFFNFYTKKKYFLMVLKQTTNVLNHRLPVL